MVETLTFIVSALPFLVAVVALVFLKWSALRSGVAAFAAAVGGALFWPMLDAGGLGGAFLTGVGTSGQVLFVLFGGLLLFNLLSAGGAIDSVSRFLGRVEPEGELLALGVVVGVAPFFESVTGFGVAVVISAPILVAAGFSPLRAAVLSTWGQCAVPWGALGIGTVIGADLSGLTFARLSDWSAVLSLPLFPVYGVCAVALAGGFGAVRRHLPEAVGVGLAAGAGTLLTSLFLAPELSGAAGGLLAVSFFLLRRRRRFTGVSVPVRAVAPYGVLVALIIFLGAIPAPTGFLSGFLQGPGLPLLLACGFAAIVFGTGVTGLKSAIPSTFKQWVPTAGSVVGFVLAGQVVAASGAARTLAETAGSTGGLYPLAAALLGGAGGALTGSNAASNALFMPLQVEAAQSAGDPKALIAGVQNVTGSHASMLAPQRVILAAAAVGITGREGEIVVKAFPPVVVSVAVVAVAALIFA